MTRGLTLKNGLNFGHHGLDSGLPIRMVITVSSELVFSQTPLLGHGHAFLQQGIYIIIKVLLEE